jgi:hypothetical protein
VGGRRTAARGAVASRGAAARSEVEDDPGGPSWAERPHTHAGKEKFQKKKWAAREFWAGLISSCAEKKKRIFTFLIQGMIFKFIFLNISELNLNWIFKI